MKLTVEKLGENGIICKKLTEITPKELGSRKKIKIFAGVNTEGYYCSMFHLIKKSRVLRKEAEELIHLHEKLETHQGTKIKKRYIWIEAPLCSKAKAHMESEGWSFL